MKKLFKIIKENKFDLLTEKNIQKTKEECAVSIEVNQGNLVLTHVNIKKALSKLTG